jgi:hypothetical protein
MDRSPGYSSNINSTISSNQVTPDRTNTRLKQL